MLAWLRSPNGRRADAVAAHPPVEFADLGKAPSDHVVVERSPAYWFSSSMTSRGETPRVLPVIRLTVAMKRFLNYLIQCTRARRI